jgi:hypothetical protein
MKPPTANMTTFTDQKSSQDIATDPRSESEPKHDGLTTPVKQKISGFQCRSRLNGAAEKRVEAGFSCRMAKRIV